MDAWQVCHPDGPPNTHVCVGGEQASHSRLERIYISPHVDARATSARVRPAPFSDHHLVWSRVVSGPGRQGSAYWHFNNRILEDLSFGAAFWEFWLSWRGQHQSFPSAQGW